MSTTWQWVIFHLFLATALWIDLGVIHKRPEAVTTRKALVWSGVWVSLALMFCAGVYYVDGRHKAALFLTGYLVEQSLSVDNLFVFYVIFQYFHTPKKYEHRILFWGIVAALVMRLGFILAGVALLERWQWLTYLLGAFLVYTAVKLVVKKEQEVHPEKIPLFRWLKPFMSGHTFDSGAFFVKRGKRWLITPAMVVLLVIDWVDLMFALDSIPAVLGITTDPFIVYTSNAMAILGLRSWYSALGKLIVAFEHLSHGLAVILAFVGIKMLIHDWYAIPIGWALGVVLAVLTTTVITSIWSRKNGRRKTRAAPDRKTASP
jgi:tellurite resistance protein TerC